METLNRYENYPAKVVFLSNLVSFGIYVLGFLILYSFDSVLAFLYLFYILILEFRLIRYHCTNCYYWGKTCGFGKGRISALFFKKVEPSKFCITEMTWKDMVPDVMVSLVPLVMGIVILIIKFNFVLLIAMILLLALTTFGNGFIRNNYACKYCKQRNIGCPAEKLFNKDK